MKTMPSLKARSLDQMLTLFFLKKGDIGKSSRKNLFFQSIEGIWIHENGTLAEEAVQAMNKSSPKNGWVGIKIDFAKVYDGRIEWPFSNEFYRSLAFHGVFFY